MIASLALAASVVAITFDDLPNLDSDLPADAQRAITTKLVDQIKTTRVPVIGFVNEDKLDDDDTSPLEQWLDAGADLGNHTYSHLDLDQSTIAQYEEDVMHGEELTRPLLESRGKTLRWFRHPYLDTGKTIGVRNEIDLFLQAHGYRVAPVTIDDSEWIYDMAYDHAPWWKRAALRRSYIRYMRRRLEFAEWSAHLVFHRNIAQILLLHASALNADTFPRLVAMMRDRGYRFVTLDEATLDDAYATPEKWAGGGVGWIERWGVDRGIAQSRFEHDPRVPAWVQKMAGDRDQ
jgi:peptidoglycan/xylan/chitin deacetylase (PgdA/CDA1 family)